MILFLLACTGTFHTELGADEVRSALWFDVNALQGREDPAIPRQSLLVLLNSTVPCAPPDVPDDPDTPTLDEAASALQYWVAQSETAFSREGALAVAMATYTFEPDWEGTYAFHSDAQIAAPDLLQAETRVAAGAWYRVDEAVLEEADGVYYKYTPTDRSFSASVDTPAWLTVGAETADTLSGRFSFTPTELSGNFRAESCDNRVLLDAILAEIVLLQYLGLAATG